MVSEDSAILTLNLFLRNLISLIHCYVKTSYGVDFCKIYVAKLSLEADHQPPASAVELAFVEK